MISFVVLSHIPFEESSLADNSVLHVLRKGLPVIVLRSAFFANAITESPVARSSSAARLSRKS